jgi:DUF1680 family protein
VHLRLLASLFASLHAAVLVAWETLPAQPLTAVPFDAVEITDPFWRGKIDVNRTATLEACLAQCERTGRIRNFAVAAGRADGEHRGHRYNDSDVYKVLEGMAYALATHPDPALQKRADDIIELIAAAQQEDGYLNTFITLAHPDRRWQDIRHGHELYCAGHLIEAGIAYHRSVGKRKLLDVAIRFADLIAAEFGPGKRMDPPGHQEIELALVKLARATGERKYLELAAFFLDRRGRPEGREALFGKYCQDHEPVCEQTEVVGHAVRAMYQFAAMADVASETGDRRLLAALDRLWHDVVDRKMYVTGGIGDSASNEGFTGPYVLPNDTAYAETCAAIGMALWNHRMFLRTGEGKYLDVMERVIYNGVLAGVSARGDRFFYTNRLGSRGGVERVPWFKTSCCPVNLVRYIPAIGERIYAHRANDLYVALHLPSRAEIPLAGGRVRVTVSRPGPAARVGSGVGPVAIAIDPEKPFAFALRIRCPSWSPDARVTLNDEPLRVANDNGFFTIARTWRPGDVFRLTFPENARRTYADPRVKAAAGRTALMLGPVVFCLEGVDHGGHVRNIFLPRRADLELRRERDSDPLEDTPCVAAEAGAVRLENGERVARPIALRAVPYALWANRGAGEMVVWIPETADLAELPGEPARAEKAGDMALCASHCFERDTLTALNDGRLPESSGDHGIPRMTWWPRTGSTEWVQYDFSNPRTVSRARVYWFDDSGRGRCRTPEAWRLLVRDGQAWKPVELTAGQRYGTALDAENSVTFRPVTTAALRLEVKLRPGFSGGILEWRVD